MKHIAPTQTLYQHPVKKRLTHAGESICYNIPSLIGHSHLQDIEYHIPEAVVEDQQVKLAFWIDGLDDMSIQPRKLYRYMKGRYSALAPRDLFERNDLLKGYKESGPVFSLFKEGTSGTAPFFWWYNPIKKDYFYSTDREGGEKSLKGYVFGGSIGNIATLKIANSRELYRWYNPDRRTHYYTVDLKGEGYRNKGYRYDGIAGYVR